MTRPIIAATLGCLFLASALGSAHAATPGVERERSLRLHLTAAVDSDCDGDLVDEPGDNAQFGTEKTLAAGQCVIYRTDYTNDGDFAIRRVELRTPVPEFMVYRPGSAAHVETPPGLSPRRPVPPTRGRGGDLVWPFQGGLGPGEAGRVEFHVVLDPTDTRLDFYRSESR